MVETIAYTVAAVVLLVYILVPQFRLMRENRHRTEFLTEFEEYLTALRHNYGEYSNIGDAVFYSRDPSKRTLKRLMSDLAGYFDDNQNIAVLQGRDPYEKLLFCICRLTDEYGEGTGSVSFTDSILKLLMDVRDEKRHLRKKNHNLRGLILMSVLPSLFVGAIGKWGTDTIPSLVSFYHGRAGSVMRVVILFLTLSSSLMIFIITSGKINTSVWRSLGKVFASPATALETIFKKFSNKIRSVLTRTNIKLSVRQVWAAMLGSLVVTALTCALAVTLGHAERRNHILSDVSDLELNMGVADSAELLHLQTVIPEYVGYYLSYEVIPSKEELVGRLETFEEFRTPGMHEMTADEIIGRLCDYRDEGTDIWDAAFVFLMAGVAFFLPYGTLVIRELFDKNRIKEEVMHFESVIDIEKDIAGMTLPIILESIADFAVVTSHAFVKCINEYNISERRALDNLSEFMFDSSFARLVGFFRTTDSLGINEAFSEISAELISMREDRKLDRSLKLDDEKLLCSLLSVIPGGVIVFLYLLIPFLVRSLDMFNTYQSSLGGL